MRRKPAIPGRVVYILEVLMNVLLENTTLPPLEYSLSRTGWLSHHPRESLFKCSGDFFREGTGKAGVQGLASSMAGDLQGSVACDLSVTCSWLVPAPGRPRQSKGGPSEVYSGLS